MLKAGKHDWCNAITHILTLQEQKTLVAKTQNEGVVRDNKIYLIVKGRAKKWIEQKEEFLILL